jgi:class 3 adenylate cyclase
LFAVCFALHLVQALHGGFAWVPFYVSSAAGPEAYPVVSTLRSPLPGMAPGDEILAVGGASLAGASRLGFVLDLFAEAKDGEVALRVRKSGAVREVGLVLEPIADVWASSTATLAFVALGALTLWRTRGLAPARLFFLFACFYGLHWCYFWGGSRLQTGLGIAAHSLGASLTTPIALLAIQSFPRETASHTSWSRVWPWAFAAVGPAVTTWAFGFPLPPNWGSTLTTLGTAASGVVVLALLTRNFRRAGPTGRRQIKWVLVGVYLGAVPPILAGLATALDPRLGWLYEASLISVLAIPVALFIALARDHLFDVDRLISATATWSVLSVLLLAGLLLAVPRLAQLGEGIVDPGVAQAALSVLVAVGVVGARSWVAPRVERVLFRESAALEEGALALRQALAASEKPSDLLETLGERLDALLAPTCTVIYVVGEDALAPVFVRGPAAAPGFELEQPLALRLAGEPGPIPVPARRRHPFWQSLAPEEASALEAMGASLLVPLRPRGVFAGFLCLGEKRSGDVWSEADRALLAGIADKASDELVRFHELELREAERAMNARLRRYVPGAIAEELERGGALPPGEREVTVLFVDVRGYASFAESRAPAAIFEAVSAYTRAVSECVRAERGTVVEFNGDGMMAVFGAPDALPDKERAAVRAALAIRRAVRALRFGEKREGLDVGVGIASGPAYVGSIQAVDRAIWSALGNTTNLAARLQALTRDQRASIALDESTQRAAADAARGFRSIGLVPIRGRSFPVEVFTYPLEDPA